MQQFDKYNRQVTIFRTQVHLLNTARILVPLKLRLVTSPLASIIYIYKFSENIATKGATICEYKNHLIDHTIFTRWIALSSHSDRWHLDTGNLPLLIADSAAVAVGSLDFVVQLDDQSYQVASPGHLHSCSQIHSAAAAVVAWLPYWLHLKYPCQTLQWHHKILLSTILHEQPQPRELCTLGYKVQVWRLKKKKQKEEE